nr:hypothetical protein GCM10020093_032650 [Planobispora longispora]
MAGRGDLPAARLVTAFETDEIAALREKNGGEGDPHRLLDYSLGGSYDRAPYTAQDLDSAWVESPEGSPYSYGLIDGTGARRIPLGKRFRSVPPFRDGAAEVILDAQTTDTIAVHPGHQRRGIGHALLQETRTRPGPGRSAEEALCEFREPLARARENRDRVAPCDAIVCRWCGNHSVAFGRCRAVGSGARRRRGAPLPDRLRPAHMGDSGVGRG